MSVRWCSDKVAGIRKVWFNMDILSLSAVELAAKIKEKEVKENQKINTQHDRSRRKIEFFANNLDINYDEIIEK